MSVPPVLLITWNRPETTFNCLSRVHAAKPARLYVAADGPRKESSEDAELCHVTRDVYKEFHWDAPVRTRFAEENSGAREAISNALRWFFLNEPEGIVLEDDSIALPEFFYFAAQMLERYRSEPGVFSIAGSNHAKALGPLNADYYLSTHQHIWGFASWRRSWEVFDAVSGLTASEIRPLVERIDDRPRGARKAWAKRVTSELTGRDDNWDSTWNLAAKSIGALCVIPHRPLVSNVGLGANSLHRKNIPLISGVPPLAVEGGRNEPLVGPKTIGALEPHDLFVSRVQWRIQPLWLTVLLGMAELIRRFLRGRNRRLGSSYLTVAEFYWSIWYRFRKRVSTL